ncbi:MAG: phosphoribosylglycinamide formyltransferase [Candidatus Nitrosocosmicus sp.]
MISGRGSNMNAILEAISLEEISNIGKVVVISNRSDSNGLQIAKSLYNVPTEVILKKSLSNKEFDSMLIDTLKSYDISPFNGLICLAGFMQILGPVMVNLYKNRILNIHPSLLPSFKGLHAQKQAIDAGVKVSGCTVHFVDDCVDHGPIILQKCVPVLDNDTDSILSDRILVEEHRLYKEAINLFVNNRLRLKGNRVFIN